MMCYMFPLSELTLFFIALLGMVGVKISFKYEKIVNVFVGKGYCDQGLFVLNVSKVINVAYLIDSYDMAC